eukprot:1008114-Rhodomonas_salina.3
MRCTALPGLRDRDPQEDEPRYHLLLVVHLHYRWYNRTTTPLRTDAIPATRMLIGGDEAVMRMVEIEEENKNLKSCLLYTSDAADDM